jgi:hypothetical protein
MLFFFYGTLMDRDLRAALLGRRAERLRVTPGVLLNYRRLAARTGDYPVLVPELRGRVSGVFVEGLDPHALLWISHFEGPLYLPGRVTAFDLQRRPIAPWSFLPTRRDVASPRPWDFRRWQRTGKREVRELLNSWTLERAPGHGAPLALDAPWLARRQLQRLVRQGHDQPRPNPHLDRAEIARDGLDEGEPGVAFAAA